MAAFRRALDLGADALEMDVHMTCDGHIVVCHDPTGLRIAGVPLAIRDCTLAQIQSWSIRGPGQVAAVIPTFAEVLREFPQTRVNVDLKQRQPCLVNTFLRQVAAHQAAQRVCIASFSSAVLRKVRRLGYSGTVALGHTEVAAVYFLPQVLASAIVGNNRIVQVPRRAGPLSFDSPSFVNKCHALGMQVDFWTINDPGEALALLRLGADGIMTDDPAALVPVVAEFRRGLGV